MSTAIRIENLYKEYNLGVIGHGTLYRDLQSWWASVRGREDPNTFIGQTVNRKVRDQILALNDINLEIMDGEVLGIIGANGAGKSTLLKILSRVTAPTKGLIKVRGRIASLLEVGTGFHLELTGRENIYLNGAINGMNNAEVSRKLDAIVDFAGVERFLDTPVKRYSSGMHVRLGFAVAAYLESEILVVDEVLAVGDAAFQKKATSKMESVSQNDGRTVLFVSHNMQSIKKLCKTAICLDQGKIIYQGSIADTINSYIKKNEGDISNNKSLLNKPRTGNRMLYFTSIEFEDEDGNELGQIVSGEPLGIRLSYECNGLVDQNSFLLDVRINDESGMEISSISTDPRGIKFNEFKKTGYIMVFFKKLCLMGGEYSIDINASTHFGTRISLDCVNNAANLTVHPGKNGSVGYAYLECDITN